MGIDCAYSRYYEQCRVRPKGVRFKISFVIFYHQVSVFEFLVYQGMLSVITTNG